MIKQYFDINGRLVRGTIYHVFPHVEKRVENEKTEDEKQKNKLRSEYESRRRAFSLASLKILENPDMNTFLTLTYDPKRFSNPSYLNDLKNLFRGTHAKYLATFERQKNNPNLHIHIITNAKLDFFKNDNGYYSVSKWHKGFSSVSFLSDTDENFRVSRYIFKYMSKSERVMHKFVYSSRNLLTEPRLIDVDLHCTNENFNKFLLDHYLNGLQLSEIMITSKYKLIKGELYEKK